MNFPQYGAVPPPAPPPVQTRYHPYGEGGGGFGKSQYKSRDGGGGIPLVQVPGYALVSDSNSGLKRHQKVCLSAEKDCVDVPMCVCV